MSKVLWLASQHQTQSFQIPSSNLADLEVIVNGATSEHLRHSPLISAPSPEQLAFEPNEDASNQPFIDPAIVSIGRMPDRFLKKTDTFATLTEPFDNLTLEPSRRETSELETTELATASANPRVSNKTRRGAKAKRGKSYQKTVDTKSPRPLSYSEATQETPSAGKKGHTSRVRSRKARQLTPLEVDSLGIVEFGSVQKERKTLVSRKQKLKTENQNGWATEEATDIQELGDFDFEANLSKFNKREVFRQLKEDDTVDESARLVGHNRIPRVGTAGSRNLHWSENVLDTPKAVNNGMWNSEAGDTADETHGDVLNSGRSSRRELSRSRTRITSSRKGSAKTIDDLSSIRAVSHTRNSRQAAFEAATSPRIKSKKPSSTSPYIGSTSTSRPSLRVHGSNKLCPCLTPLQALEFEQYAVTELGLNEDMLAENAARGMAETIARVLESGKENSTQPSTIVLVAGNHKTGARALAACRHLCNHGFMVTATVMSFGREEDLFESLRRQKQTFLKAGGVMMKPNELLEGLKTRGLRFDLFMDALLAAHTLFDDLRRNEQAWCFELVILMNRTTAKVVSIDVPSGIDASNGEITVVEGSALAIYPHVIISLGAPKPSLLTMLEAAGTTSNPELYVADIGVSSSIWRKVGHKKHRGVDFGTEWVVRLRYQPGVE